MTTSTVKLPQVAAGRYEAAFPVPTEGVYLVRTQATGAPVGSVANTFGLVVPYSPEYRGDQGDDTLMSRIAQSTGGRALSLADTAGVFAHNLAPVKTSTPLWPLLVLIAVLLLPIDIGVRRVAIFRSDVARGLAAARSRLPGALRPAPATAHASATQIGSLSRAKQRIDDRIAQERANQGLTMAERAQTGDHPFTAGASNPQQPYRAGDYQLSGREGRTADAGNAEAGRPADQSDTAPPESADTLAARLRKAREERQ